MNWVVNLREKFETICTEMEDKLSQEAKYVESQVQTVGVNVNKFFAETLSGCRLNMQDFLPSSCMNPAHRKASSSYLVKNADGMNEDCRKTKVFHEESEGIAPVVNESCPSPSEDEIAHVRNDSCLSKDPDFCGANGFLSPASAAPLNGTGSVKPPEGNTVLKISEPTTEADNSVMTGKHDIHLLGVVAPITHQGSLLSSPQETVHLDSGASWDPTNEVDSSLSTKENNGVLINEQSPVDQEENSVNVEPLAEKHAPLLSEVVAQMNYQVSLPGSPQNTIHLNPEACLDSEEYVDLNLYVKEDNDILVNKQSTEDQKDYTVHVNLPLPVASAVLSSCWHESSPQSGFVSDEVVDAMEYCPDISSSLSSYGLDSSAVHYKDMESGFSPSSTSLPTDSEGCSDVAAIKSCMENIELFDDVKLGDSCIVVDNKNLHIPPRTSPHRSFKQALASRMRSTKREYEQLAILYGDIDTDISLRRESSPSYFPVNDTQLKKLSGNDLSDWEIV